ncbi:MAG: SCP2 sterol-binding domain-containing protein [Myxococcota bacterium]
MAHDPITFLKETFPALFAKGVADLEAEGKTAALEDVRGATGAVALHVEGEGEVFLRVADGTMTVLDAAPDPSEINLAVAAPGDAMRMLLGEAEDAGELEEGLAAKRAVGTASKRLQDALGADSLEFHVIAEDVPDLGNVTVRIGLNAPEPPVEPKFTATIKFDDLEAARNGEVNVQQLFMGGKLRMAGDYSRALQLGMQLMQQMQ